jgi:hypothetical protein
MYNKILAEIKPIESSAKITYSSAFDPDFCLLLRERRATSFAHMKYVALEVESNVLVANQIRNKADRNIPRGRSQDMTSGPFTSPPQMDEVTKLLKSLSTRMERLEVEGNPTYINPQNVDNRGNFRRPNNNSPKIMTREQRDRDRNDQKIQTPLKNNLVINEETKEEDLDPEIYCLGDTSPFPHLTQSAYEESLMNSQINELSKGEKENGGPSKYNLWYKKKEGKSDIHDQRSKAEKPTKDATNNNK